MHDDADDRDREHANWDGHDAAEGELTRDHAHPGDQGCCDLIHV